MTDTETALRALTKGQRQDFYTSPTGVKVFALRTDKICTNDFAVGLGIPGRSDFYPTHVRLFVDLYIKNQSSPQNAHQLFCALEQVYSGNDPDQFVNSLSSLAFPMQLDEANVNLYYTQLLMLEQDFNYGPMGCRTTKSQPPRAYFMGFIRALAAGVEIDKLVQQLGFGVAKKIADKPIDCTDLVLQTFSTRRTQND